MYNVGRYQDVYNLFVVVFPAIILTGGGDRTNNGNDKWKLTQVKYWKREELQVLSHPRDLKTERSGIWSCSCDSKHDTRWLEKS